jgi:PTS system mannose-specific IID component
MTVVLPRSARMSAFARSFAIQGSWNYRSMIGGGFAFAMLPVLRRLFEGEQFEAALARHAEHFNSHPYLAGLALGASARLEADGADPELVRRFKTAIKGPLGALGDGLVWAAWLPTTALLGLCGYFLGLPPLACVLLFLIPYNVGHLALRAWGFNAGLRWGHEVGRVLREAALGPRGEWVVRAGTVLLGVFSGLLAVIGFRGGPLGGLWVALGAAAFVAGLLGGLRAWRPAALVAVGTVVFILTLGSL